MDHRSPSRAVSRRLRPSSARARACALAALLVAACLAGTAAAEPRVVARIVPGGTLISSSTYTSGSFQVENQSTAGERIARIAIDLSSAMLPDLVFDPAGTGGDTIAKPFTPDSGGAQVGLGTHAFFAPRGGGFDGLEIAFADFDPGETFTFSVDVDPTSIQGTTAPGPGESGSVSGLELVGARVEAELAGGALLEGATYRLPASATASQATLRPAPPPAPALQVLGATPPQDVFDAAQVVRVTGTPGAQVAVLDLEGALYTAGLPGGGFDLDPFEANSAVAVAESVAVVGAGGSVEVPVTLTRSVAEGGIHHLAAVQLDAQGTPGPPSPVAVVRFAPAPQIAFVKSVLQGTNSQAPTSLQFGPDDRLYVAQQDGRIRVYTLERFAADDYRVTATETISLIQQIPNHDDNGQPNPGVTSRQVTGILVTGSPSSPVVYVSSSDPRIGAGGSGTDLGLDTNSGVVSRLTLVGGVWQRQDLVRGLPRSEENHSVNGMQLDAATNTLYLAVGGFTNMGAPSNNFAFTPEYALSAAILTIDLDALGPLPYDLPTLDDEDRPGNPDANDPFGGNDGKNQAILVPGGPVQIHSPGWRNPYDLLLTADGRLYSVDNGPNAGWGAPPLDAGNGTCTNAVREPGVTWPDGLHFVSGPGYYAGHPNPTRANPANTFNGSNPQSPVSVGSPVECQYRIPGQGDGALATWDSSTNGLAEYTSSAFAGQMQGDLLAVSFANQLQRVRLNATGDGAELVQTLFSSVGSTPLDVTTRGDADPFPGTIWVADIGNGTITVYEPEGSVFLCTGADDPALDEDGDGYSNADEIDNGTSPCSPGDVPPDADGDLVSDRNDPDDDDDGRPDVSDPFAIDPADGLDTLLPLVLSWDNDAPEPGGLLGLGFTGLMTNGVDDYAALFDPANMTAGGAAGVTTVDAVPPGDARDDEQQYGFQVGVRVTPGTPRFVVHTRLMAPFAGTTPSGGESFGLFVGTGDQDHYAKLVASPTAVFVAVELGGTYLELASAPLALPGPEAVDLFLEVDPLQATVQPRYRVVIGGVPGPELPVGGPIALPAVWFDGVRALALGILATSRDGAPYPATWDRLDATFVDFSPSEPPVAVRLNAGGPVVPSIDDGPDWAGDASLVSAGTSTFSTTAAIALDPSVPAGTPAALFQTERWDPPEGSEMTYEIPVQPGAPLQVRLHFAEIFSGAFAPGARVFDVDVEGVRVLEDLDVYAEAGANRGLTKTFATSAADGSLTIVFRHQIENPKVAAIEVRSAAGSPECNDGIDNDGDGLVDVLQDPGCRSAEAGSVEGPECNDGLDDDGDGLVDYPADPGCTAPYADSERAACENGLDDDGDGLVDHPADPQCQSPLGQRESAPSACGWGGELALGPLAWLARRRRRVSARGCT